MPTFEYTMEVIDSPMVSPGIVYNNFEVSIPTFEYTMEVIDHSTVSPEMIYNNERIRCPPLSIHWRLLTPQR